MKTSEQLEFEENWHYLRVLLKECGHMQPEVRSALLFAERNLGKEYQEKIIKGEWLV